MIRSRFGALIAVLALPLIISCDPPPEPCMQELDVAPAGRFGRAIRFCGTGINDIDRVKIAIDDPTNTVPGPAMDVGATDFTIEWWMRAHPGANRTGAVPCGENLNWINGNILIDRDRYNQGRKYGVSVAGGRIVFGTSGEGDLHRTICGSIPVADGQWHHVAVQRRISDGYLTVWVDGKLDAEGPGPIGDISYPDDGVPRSFCGGPCVNSDPYLVIGAEKHDAGPAWPAYRGWFDELRISTTLRYAAEFDVPSGPFQSDSATAGLWHFDEEEGESVLDSSPHSTHGVLRIGGPFGAPFRERSGAGGEGGAL